MADVEHEPRMIVTYYASVDEAPSTGEQRVRRIFDADRTPFQSGFQFVLRNRLPAGSANERHVHPDVEKVYYFLAGAGEVRCGPWTKRVGPGDFLFFPAAIEHQIHADTGADLEFIVCAARTVGTPRGLD